jgi:hypothetical protein
MWAYYAGLFRHVPEHFRNIWEAVAFWLALAVSVAAAISPAFSNWYQALKLPWWATLFPVIILAGYALLSANYAHVLALGKESAERGDRLTEFKEDNLRVRRELVAEVVRSREKISSRLTSLVDSQSSGLALREKIYHQWQENASAIEVSEWATAVRDFLDREAPTFRNQFFQPSLRPFCLLEILKIAGTGMLWIRT